MDLCAAQRFPATEKGGSHLELSPAHSVGHIREFGSRFRRGGGGEWLREEPDD